MPDADGNIKGISVPADAWERVFGNPWIAKQEARGVRVVLDPEIRPGDIRFELECCGCGGCDTE